MANDKYPIRNPARGVKFLVFAVIIGVIALLRAVAIEPFSLLGLALLATSLVALTLVLRWLLAKLR